MADSVVKIYGDGEFWIDGQRRAKLYPDGDIWADGKKVGKVYEDGDIWIDGQSVGRVFSNGDLWIGSRKVATGIYLLDLLDSNGNPPVRTQPSVPKIVNNFTPKGAPGVGNFSSGCSGVGCGTIFVVVLLIVALIYACFAMWFSELPQLLFGNFQSVGNAPMISVYICMVMMIYQHCKLATRNGRVQFFKGLLMQGGSFIVNVVVFTILDLIITACHYGIPVGDALGELGGLLGGFGGMIVGSLLVAVAPTTVSSIISAICIKKHVNIPDLPVPNVKRPTNGAAKKTNTTAKKTYTTTKNTNTTTKKSSIDGVTIFFFLLTLLAVYLNAAMPFAAILGMDALSYMPIGEIIWIPTIALVVGVIIRRVKCEYSGFWGHWITQSLVMALGNCINVDVVGFSDPAGGFIVSTVIVTCLVSFLATIATAMFMKR